MLGNYIVIKRASGEFEDQNLKSNTGLLVYLVVIFSALLLASMTWNVGCNGELTPNDIFFMSISSNGSGDVGGTRVRLGVME